MTLTVLILILAAMAAALSQIEAHPLPALAVCALLAAASVGLAALEERAGR